MKSNWIAKGRDDVSLDGKMVAIKRIKKVETKESFDELRVWDLES